MAKRRDFLVAFATVAASLGAASCAIDRGEPKTPAACAQVLELPCVNGRVCTAEGGGSCQVCRCLAPPVAPLDHEWQADPAMAPNALTPRSPP